ncbi:acyl-CoA dehydrogenase C-terminal domain-containing protein [Thalassospira alkalitolerans]|uniref:acyl-CoA dehydrogenase C-terminal domain-containing protein n=1 Tax=Thalassospira alkalitolerans TaxID=1293890 RepID=UPI003AA8583F
MAQYKAPLRDMRFVLGELFDYSDINQMPGCEDFTPDVVDAVLEEAAKVCEEILYPINRSGDEEGCHWDDGVVTTPKGFKEAYDAFAQGGWTGIACDPVYGGQGAPKSINALVEEMICSTNLSFGMYPGLSFGAYAALHSHASDALKDKFLPKMVEGTWAGTMCLTEPHCGTDLGIIKTKADPLADGSYSITGTKIFISAGEHDLTENIIHLVLAKLPDAPKGTKGISLFLVPKFMVGDDGSMGKHNAVKCGSIEHKMGIKASSTCVMNFDGAIGYLVGEPHQGMPAMFTMMNQERLSVGIQGLGLGEAAYQGAAAYARDRLQGRALTGAKSPEKPADSLLVHPDIRRMLLTARATNEGCRAMGMWVARALDTAKHHTDPVKREEAEEFVQLMTPIVKALFTDWGFDNTNLGVQVFGGHGYIREWGMEQYVRDARIAQIYEGTNGIQALDLVGRKMPAKAGRNLRRFFHPVQAYIEANVSKDGLGEFVQPLAKAFMRLQQATGELAQRGMKNPDEAGAAATEFLRLFGLVAVGFMWARMAEIALAKKDDDPDGFYKTKLITAKFYMERVLPQSGALFSAIMAGSKTIMELDEDLF